MLVLLLREFQLVSTRWSQMLGMLAFYMMSVLLFLFAVGVKDALLKEVGVGILWVCAILASMMHVDTLFEQDDRDGSLAQLLSAGMMVEAIVWAKICVHWCSTALPLLLLTPLLGMMLGISPWLWVSLLTSLGIGMAILSCLGGLIAALTLGNGKRHALMVVLLLPLMVPAVIFGVSAMDVTSYFTEREVYALLFGNLCIVAPVSVVGASVMIKHHIIDS